MVPNNRFAGSSFRGGPTFECFLCSTKLATISLSKPYIYTRGHPHIEHHQIQDCVSGLDVVFVSKE